MKKTFALDFKPPLKNPLLVIGFSGWANAGEVSSGALEYLIGSLEAVRFGRINPEEFFNLTRSRPQASIDRGVIRELKYPSCDFYYVQKEGLPVELILFSSEEPHLRWHGFISCIIEVARSFAVKKIITIGGVLDHVPHTMEPLLMALSNEESARDYLLSRGIQMIDYTGPSSIHGPLLDEASRHGMGYVSLWGRSPYYVQTINYKILHRILEVFGEIAGIGLNLKALEEYGEQFEKKVSLAVQNKPELQDYIRTLEKQYLSPPAKEGPPEKKKGPSKVIKIKAFVKEEPEPPEES